MEVAVIHWLDAMSDRGPLTLTGIKQLGPLPIVTVGLLISQDEEVIRVAQDWSLFSGGISEHRYREVAVIPKTYITKLEILIASDE
ncbi:hypothetical protein LCGC14_1575860 [marine sediment metagenome]|uniref:Uncharacterized protein n=1 Tax=marine sediment metagenome TaxID=412755 RepID=A0A0F9IIF3_9ZZZZ